MTDLVSLRALIMSPEQGLCDLLRRAWAGAAVPLEMVEVRDAAAATRALAGGIDLAYLDGAAPPRTAQPGNCGNAQRGKVALYPSARRCRRGRAGIRG